MVCTHRRQFARASASEPRPSTAVVGFDSVLPLLKLRVKCIFRRRPLNDYEIFPARVEAGISCAAQMIIIRCSLFLVSIFALLGATTGRGDDVLPSHSNFDRYSPMVDRSPFAVATAVALPAATPDFAKDLYVANAAHSPDADIVTIASTSDRNFKKYLTSKQPVDGYRIESVEWSDRVGASKATISKDGKFATLTFNEALLSQRATPNAPPASGQMPQSMPPPQSMPQMPSSDAVQAPRVPAKALRKPGTIAVPAPNPQQQQQEQQQQQRVLEQKLEILRKQKP